MARTLRVSVSTLSLLPLALCTATAQDYAPFSSGSRKLFATIPEQAATVSLTFDSVTTGANNTRFHVFPAPAPDAIPSNCGWWGDQACRPLTQPTGMGLLIDRDEFDQYTFHNVWGEPITIPFHTDPDAPVTIYSDATQRFVMDFVGIAPMADVLGQMDNLKHYTLAHEDLDGLPINSALNGASIDVGEELGLFRFFRVDSFPQMLQPLELVGQGNDELGLHKLTPAIVHDHQPGDELQWHDVGYQNIGPPDLNYDRYVKHIILERNNVAGAVEYAVRREIFDVGALNAVIDTVLLNYSTEQVDASIPFERFNGTTPVLGRTGQCELLRWTYTTVPNPGLGFCEAEKCWGPIDTNGPPPTGVSQEVVGLGTYHYSSVYQFLGTMNTTERNLVYFLKDGVSCGSEVMVGIHDVAQPGPNVELWPTPARDVLYFRSTKPLKHITLVDLNGRTVLNAPLSGNRDQVDVAGLPAGLYVALVTPVNGPGTRTRVLVSGR